MKTVYTGIEGLILEDFTGSWHIVKIHSNARQGEQHGVVALLEDEMYFNIHVYKYGDSDGRLFIIDWMLTLLDWEDPGVPDGIEGEDT